VDVVDIGVVGAGQILGRAVGPVARVRGQADLPELLPRQGAEIKNPVVPGALAVRDHLLIGMSPQEILVADVVICLRVNIVAQGRPCPIGPPHVHTATEIRRAVGDVDVISQEAVGRDGLVGPGIDEVDVSELIGLGIGKIAGQQHRLGIAGGLRSFRQAEPGEKGYQGAQKLCEFYSQSFIYICGRLERGQRHHPGSPRLPVYGK
jgi:hypothetical protein